jgi:hypothetical protein
MYNHYFIETIQKACKEHAKESGSIAECLLQNQA